jgi:hypothetical protein
MPTNTATRLSGFLALALRAIIFALPVTQFASSAVYGSSLNVTIDLKGQKGFSDGFPYLDSVVPVDFETIMPLFLESI